MASALPLSREAAAASGFFGVLGGPLGRPGASKGHLRASWARLGASWLSPGASWSRLGASWEPRWEGQRPGPLLLFREAAASGGFFGGVGAFLARYLAFSASKKESTT